MHDPEHEEEGTVPTIAPETASQGASDQGCEPAIAAIEGILVEVDSEDWLINFDMEGLPPTLSHPVLSVSSQSSLFQHSTKHCMDCDLSVYSETSLFLDNTGTVLLTCWESDLPALILSNLPRSPSLQISASLLTLPLLDACCPSLYRGMPCCDVESQVASGQATTISA